MVESVSSWSRNGLRDFILQRISAVVIAAYVIVLVLYCFLHQYVQYDDWQALYACNWMRIFSVLTLFSLIVHAWVGMWTIATDYLKCTVLRGGFLLLVALMLFVCLVWGIMILWSM